jgi:hypothetical protein
MTKLNEWIKNTEQQIKDPFTNDLQQPANILKEKLKNVQVRIDTNMQKRNRQIRRKYF